MMRAGSRWAVAVRRPGGEIVEEAGDVPAWATMGRRLPVLRGAIALVVTMVLGMRALGWSRRLVSRDPGQSEPAGERLAAAGAVLVSLTVFVSLFAVLPAAGARLTFAGGLGFAAVEALLRMALLVGYIAAIGRLPGIRRTFAYHGAEHAAVAAHEAGAELSAESVATFSPRHARCGTDFLVLSAVVAVAVFALVTPQGWWALIGSRLLLMPLVAGLAYELLISSARPGSRRWVAPLLAPGMAVQRLTTRPFTQAEAEVAVAALRAALAAPVRPGADGGPISP